MNTKNQTPMTTNADFMKSVQFSDSTRDYLVAWGKFEDAADFFYSVLKRDLSEEEAERIGTEEFIHHFESIKKTILNSMLEKMKDNFSETNKIAI